MKGRRGVSKCYFPLAFILAPNGLKINSKHKLIHVKGSPGILNGEKRLTKSASFYGHKILKYPK